MNKKEEKEWANLLDEIHEPREDKYEELNKILKIAQEDELIKLLQSNLSDYQELQSYLSDYRDTCEFDYNCQIYDSEELIKEIKAIGAKKYQSYDEIKTIESKIDYLINKAIRDADFIDYDTYIRCYIEDEVIAIGIDKGIPDAKYCLGNILELNSDIFIEVVGPSSTVLLIDARRWYLEELINGAISWHQ